MNISRDQRCFASLLWAAAAAVALVAGGCGDDSNGGTPADRLGVGAACSVDAVCPLAATQSERDLVCLAFKGGYCGLAGCSGHDECPSGSACVRHDDSQNYCFRTCIDKAECNLHRAPDEESNCSSSIEFVGGDPVGNAKKACVPPSS